MEKGKLRPKAPRFEVQRIISERRNSNGTKSFLIDWGNKYKPTWEPSEVIEKDCPIVVASFNMAAELLKNVLRCQAAPNNPLFTWNTTTVPLLKLTPSCSKYQWRPEERKRAIARLTAAHCSLSAVAVYSRFLDTEGSSEAGKMPPLSLLLSEALSHMPSRNLYIAPEYKVLGEYKCDCSITVGRVRDDIQRTTEPLIMYELKPAVSVALGDIKECHLAQTIVEGYYTLLHRSLPYVVVAITNISITHYFKLVLSSDSQPNVQVVWHHCLQISYPPKEESDLKPFVAAVIDILDEIYPGTIKEILFKMSGWKEVMKFGRGHHDRSD